MDKLGLLNLNKIQVVILLEPLIQVFWNLFVGNSWAILEFCQ